MSCSGEVVALLKVSIMEKSSSVLLRGMEEMRVEYIEVSAPSYTSTAGSFLGIDRAKMREVPMLSGQDPHEKGSLSNRMAWMGLENRRGLSKNNPWIKTSASTMLDSTKGKWTRAIFTRFGQSTTQKNSVHFLF